ERLGDCMAPGFSFAGVSDRDGPCPRAGDIAGARADHRPVGGLPDLSSSGTEGIRRRPQRLLWPRDWRSVSAGYARDARLGESDREIPLQSGAATGRYSGRATVETAPGVAGGDR